MDKTAASDQLCDIGQEIWLTTTDGMKHLARVWNGRSGGPVVVYMHGIEGHSLWFAHTAKELAEAGISVWALDRRGAGKSPARRGHTDSWQLLLEDGRQLISQVVERTGGQPIFLMANCWGAKVAALLAKRQDPCARLLRGLVLSSPAVAVKVDVSFREKLAIAWNFLTGNLTPLPIPLEPEHFTDNPEYLRFIEQDDLRLTHATGRFFVEGVILTILSGKAASSIDLPVLVVQAGTDRIVDEHGLDKWFAELASSDKTFKTFAGVHHSLDFDRDPAEYRRLLSQWLLKHQEAA